MPVNRLTTSPVLNADSMSIIGTEKGGKKEFELSGILVFTRVYISEASRRGR